MTDTPTLSWGHSEYLDAFGQAMVDLWADQEFANPIAAAEGKIPGKDGKSGYSYRYAKLGSILADLRPVMARHGLVLIATPTGGGRTVSVTSTLMHASGQHWWCTCTLDAGAGPQAQGGSITYARRYSLLGLLGLFNDDEDDGGEAAQRAVHAAQRYTEAAERGAQRSGRTAPAQQQDPPPAAFSWAAIGWEGADDTAKAEHDAAMAAITADIAARDAQVQGFREAVRTQVWRANGYRLPLSTAQMVAYEDAVEALWVSQYADQAPFDGDDGSGDGHGGPY